MNLYGERTGLFNNFRGHTTSKVNTGAYDAF